MSANKKRYTEEPMMEASDDDSDNDDNNPEAYTGNEEIQVDFEGRNPIDCDFHGIRQLLMQLFLKAKIDLTELTNIIISQNYIGSVVQQSEVDEEEDEDDDDDQNLVFGITSAINLTNKQDIPCIQQLVSHLITNAESFGTAQAFTMLRDILSDVSKPVGILINERFINIPPQIAVPLLENLSKEIRRAADKKMPYNFVYYLMVIKFYRKEAKKNKPIEDLYSNPEEEVIAKQSLASFEYTVKTETDSGLSGDWLEGDQSLTPFRKVIVFEAKSLPNIISSIKEFIA